MDNVRSTTKPVAEHSAILERLCAVEHTSAVRLADALVGNNAEADDFVQESFVEAARPLNEVHRPGDDHPPIGTTRRPGRGCEWTL